MSDTPKIIQLLMCRNDNVWQGALLGLGDDGVTYHCQSGTWQHCIPKIALEDKAIELAEVTKQRDLLVEGLEKIASLDFVMTLPDRMDAVREIANETLNKLKP